MLNTMLNPRHDYFFKCRSLSGREIIGRYLLGFDNIDIEAKDRIDSNVRNIVKSTANSLAGLMIVEETPSKISLQTLGQQPSSLPEKLLQRNYAIAAGMIRDAVNSFINGECEVGKKRHRKG